MRSPLRPAALALLLLATVAGRSPDDLDEFIMAQMARRHVPGLSIAIVNEGRVVLSRGYGVTEAGGNLPVTTATLFQAGSVSKSVAALGALHLVEAGTLSLDGDVNDKLFNANDNSGMTGAIAGFVARMYGFPNAPPAPPARVAAAVPAAELRALTGRYEFRNNQMIELRTNDTLIQRMTDGFPDEEYYPQGGGRFVSGTRNAEFTVVQQGADAITGLTWRAADGSTRPIPRIGPLISSLPRGDDPDPRGTDRARAALTALSRGGTAVADSPDFTEGAKRNLGTAPIRDLAEMRGVTFVGSESVAGRGIERHGHAVARIVYFGFDNARGRRYALVHLTAEGRVTDYDVVDN